MLTMSIIVIRSVSPLPYDLDSPYLFHTLIIVCACQAGMCHLILTSFSFSQFTDCFHIQPRFTIFDLHINHGGCMSARHVSPDLYLFHFLGPLTLLKWEICQVLDATKST